MDSPQYEKVQMIMCLYLVSFKPYYKWIVLNTEIKENTKETSTKF